MVLTAAWTEVVLIERPGERDKFGEVASYETHLIKGCIFVPGTPTESGEWNLTQATTATLLGPYGADLVGTDRIQFRKRKGIWEVSGDPVHWRSPISGHRKGFSAVITLVEN